MSTPTGKPPIDLLAHVPHETHERAGPRHHAVESDSEPNRPPYASTRARERAGPEPSPEENNNESVVSRYAPKKARTQPFQGLDVAAREDGTPLVSPRAPERLREQPERHDVKGAYPFSHEPDFEASLQPARPHSQPYEQPAPSRRDAGIADLKRLEATLRWIQHEEAARRIPRAAQLPPVSGLAAAEPRGGRHRGEMLDILPRSLEPERMAPPPTRLRRRGLRAALIVLIASIFAAPIGYYFSTRNWSLSSPPGPHIASLAPKTNAPPSSIGQQEFLRRDGDSAMSAQGEASSQRPETSQPRGPSEGKTVAMLHPSAIGDQAPPSSKAVRVLAPEEIKLLMKQGEQLIAAGDVVTARTVWQRAAEAGDANAAIALGATYDPNVLAKLGVVGVSADVEQARSWYQKAEALGSPDARRRLDLLANR